MARGAFLLSFANAVRLGMQVLMLPILARILGPEAYGVMGLAMPFIVFVNLVSDAGLAGALVREARPSRELEATVFWATLGCSVVLSALLALLAWPLAAALGRPAVAPVLAALSPLLILGGLNAVPTARIMREERFAALARADILAPLAGSACGFAAALGGFGVWSLVVQQAVLWIVRLAVLWFAADLRIAWTFQPKLLGRLTIFGANSVASGLLDMASRNIDNVVVGAILGVNALGHYAMAYQLVRMPEMLVVGPMYTSLFPKTAQLSDRLDQASRLFLDSLRGMALICAPALAGLAAVATPFTAVVLGAKWAGAGPLIQWLTPAGFVLCVLGLMTALLLGLGFSHLRLRLSAIFAATTLAGIVAGAQVGVVGVAIGLSAGSLAALAFVADALRRHCRLELRAVALELQPIAVASALMFAAVKAVESGASGLTPPLMLAAGIATGAAVYLGAMGVLDRPRLARDAAALLTLIQRRPA